MNGDKTFMILAINPGSTSTKIAVFENKTEKFSKTLRHPSDEIAKYPTISSQYQFRKQAILDCLAEMSVPTSSLNAVVGRGGLLYPLEGGTYAIDETMVQHLKQGVQGEHASNLGGLLANEIAKEAGNIRSFIVDPVVVDEMEPCARLSGHPLIERRSIFHALNQKAVARKAALSLGKPYEDLNLIMVHLGGGISVGAHKKGRVVDVNNALNGDGPFAPERSGGLPTGDLAKLCFSGKYTLPEVMDMLRGKGGVVAYCGINDIRVLWEKVVGGDEFAKLVFESLAYQVAKEIGSLATVMFGDVDAVVLTGGIANEVHFTNMIASRTDWIAPVIVIPGEEEMEALVEGALRVLDGTEKAKEYKPKVK
jgi:butyrate kinase